jgi:CDGSH-type Zn-finger protein
MDDKNKYKDLMPFAIDVERGKTYLWCQCGHSQTQPLCDEHCIDCEPISYEAKHNETLYFCMCKHTKHPPLCDGSHSKLLIESIKIKKNNTKGME